MASLKKALVLVAAILLGLVVIGFLLPSDYKVQRSIVISAPSAKIFPHLADLKKWQDWGVWFKRDPNMSIEYSGDDGQIGMTSRWTSATQGNGEMTIIALEDNRRLIYSLSFPEMPNPSTGEFLLKQVEGGTEVQWMDYGDVGMNPINHYFAFLMDYMLGPDFEMGLDNLKMISEASL
ncbi:SRPBCC family protein [Paraglaciecola hydrolytica]|uniref:Polyketide cyclase n=1 Tax=Paraglaciecola hydrolytica TaxID=1799789 RepID=A0A136A426_9ALTE|nr:SRPBCC family protein [Paraglaciecola hydrolytica]KXI29995.1 polyketide cyclase [Paraglaciecola hydrolytica]